jgi:NAD(P)-dependent dehydrogenase (short-subunit alcohol dehydrogenase family)
MNGKIALISGAGSGIGRAAALQLAAEGARVLATDQNEAAAREVTDQIVKSNGQSAFCRLDVTAERDWQSAVEVAGNRWGGLHVLVASAGISFGKPLTETSLEEWRKVLSINLDGVFLGLKHCIPAIAKSGGGSIVIISSVSGIKAAAGAGAYATSKAALRLLAKTAALEGAKSGIRVNSVLPGGVETPMWQTMPFFQDLIAQLGSEEAAFHALGAAAPLGRLAKPEEIADAIIYLASDESQFVTGAELVIDGGYTA